MMTPPLRLKDKYAQQTNRRAMLGYPVAALLFFQPVETLSYFSASVFDRMVAVRSDIIVNGVAVRSDRSHDRRAPTLRLLVSTNRRQFTRQHRILRHIAASSAEFSRVKKIRASIAPAIQRETHDSHTVSRSLPSAHLQAQARHPRHFSGWRYR